MRLKAKSKTAHKKLNIILEPWCLGENLLVGSEPCSHKTLLPCLGIWEMHVFFAPSSSSSHFSAFSCHLSSRFDGWYSGMAYLFFHMFQHSVNSFQIPLPFGVSATNAIEVDEIFPAKQSHQPLKWWLHYYNSHWISYCSMSRENCSHKSMPAIPSAFSNF